MNPEHPILDHSSAIRSAADRLGLHSLDRRWKGWTTSHRFKCQQGHIVRKTPTALISKRAGGCPKCAAAACLERLKLAAAEANVRCVSRVWRGASASYRFVCLHGHRWHRRGSNARANAACPICKHQATRSTRLLKDGLKQLRSAARQNKGWCLSTAYVGSAALYRFRCAAGHEWEMAGSEVLHKGHWCSRCSDERKRRTYLLPDGLQRLSEAAVAQGGRCLSATYAGVAATYRFQCAHGHVWETVGARILRGAWCRGCANEAASERNRSRDGLKRLQLAAERQGGVCLAVDYRGTAQRYRWRCGAGHEWEALGAAVIRGTWCLKCAQESRRLGVGKCQELAARRGGQCVSTEYRNQSALMQWCCHRGHSWHTSMASVMQGHWCPTCAHEAQISNRKSKARMRYRPVGSTPA